MELRLLCIKPPKLYVNSSRKWEHIGIRWGYKSEAKWEKQDYCLFLGSATLSEVIKQAVVTSCTCGCHTRYDKHKPSQRPQSSYHINSSFSEWLLWVIVFTYTTIDMVKDIMTGICVAIAIISTFIKNKKIFVDKVNYDMRNKVYGCGQSISIVTRYRKPVTIRKSPLTPEAVILATQVAACDHGPAAGPKFPINWFVTQLLLLQI